MHRTTLFILTAAALALTALTLRPTAPLHVVAPPSHPPPRPISAPLAPQGGTTSSTLTTTTALSHSQLAPGGLTYAEVHVRAAADAPTAQAPVSVALVIDVSGSMQGEKMTSAKKGTAQFIRTMEKDDQVAVMAFSDKPRLVKPIASVREAGEALATQVEGLFADGGTAMYDATVEALEAIEKAKKDDPSRLYGIVLLSDGKDTSSKRTLSDLLDKMPTTESADGTRIFTVAYGTDADEDLLKQISDRSNARMMKGDAKDIDKIYHSIAAYF